MAAVRSSGAVVNDYADSSQASLAKRLQCRYGDVLENAEIKKH